MNKSPFYIVGQHAVIEALKNPKRKVLKVFLTEESKKNINRKVNIRFRKDDKLDEINCKILSADDDTVMVKHRNSDIPISYNQIKDAKLILSFK